MLPISILITLLEKSLEIGILRKQLSMLPSIVRNGAKDVFQKKGV